MSTRPGPEGSGRGAEGGESERSTVLISAAGGSGTIEIIRTLGQTGRYRIIALDASPLAVGLQLADRGYTVPLATDRTFGDALEEIVVRERVDFIVPLVDEEIGLVHEVASCHGAVVIAPGPAFCALALDKWEMTLALDGAGIPVPGTHLASELGPVRYPAVVKPRRGRGSRGVRTLADRGALDRYLSEAGEAPDSYIVQERIEGTEFTCSVVVSLSGGILSVVPKEVILKRGITHAAVTRSSARIDAVCRSVQENLRADGPFNVQLIIDRKGVPRIIEINPRYSTTVALTIASGVHEVDCVIREALGDSPEIPRFRRDLVMLRYFGQIYVDESDWRGGAVPAAVAEDRLG